MIKSLVRNTHLPLIALLGFALAVLLFFPGCQTMKGAGKDLENAGEKIQEKAN